MLNFYILLLFQGVFPTPTPVRPVSDFPKYLWFAIGIVLGILITIEFRKSQNQADNHPAQIASIKPDLVNPVSTDIIQSLRRCPRCKSTYTDKTLQFCLNDGARLENLNDEASSDDPEKTRLSSGEKPLPTELYSSNPIKRKQ